VDVDDIARAALIEGTTAEATRSALASGEPKAVAVDAHDGVAAVLVIHRQTDEEWVVDVVRFVDEDGDWFSLGYGGGAYGNIPIDHDPGAPPGLGPLSTSWSALTTTGS